MGRARVGQAPAFARGGAYFLRADARFTGALRALVTQNLGRERVEGRAPEAPELLGQVSVAASGLMSFS